MIAASVALAVAWTAVAQAADPPSLQAVEQAGTRPVEALPEVERRSFVLAGGTVLTAAGDRFAPGWVVVEAGRIEAVGGGEAPEVEGAEVLDVSGRFVTPGLIDTHSHLGVYPSPGARAHGDGNEATAPVTAGVWAEHSTWPQDPGLHRAIAGGVTSLHILPGSANLIGGRGVTLQAVPARGPRAMRFPGAPETVKMACGENPKRVYGDKGGPSTRMGNLEGQRSAFIAAGQYVDAWQDFAAEHAEWQAEKVAHEGADTRRARKQHPDPGDPPDPPERDLSKETLAGVLQGEILPQVHCYRADDMLAMLQVADEMGFGIRSFHHALEAYKIRDILAEREVAVSTWADWWGFKLEAYDGIPYNLALVSEAGGLAVVHSDSSIGIQRLNQEAAKARRWGLEQGIEIGDDEALRWITANPAWALGILDQTGTLEPGKRADIAVWSASPWSVYAEAELVFVDGLLRYDAERPQVWSDFRVGQEVRP